MEGWDNKCDAKAKILELSFEFFQLAVMVDFSVNLL